jgi:hypothetical protein
MKALIKSLIACGIITGGALFLPSDSSCDQTEHHIARHYQSVSEGLYRSGFCRPMARRVAEFALFRQLHENGATRPHTYCVPGIGIGPKTRGICDRVSETHIYNVRISRVVDTEGIPMFAFHGEDATIVGSVMVGNVFDWYVSELGGFSQVDRNTWKLAKNSIAGYYRNRAVIDATLARCNLMFGPQGHAINTTDQRYQLTFKRYR